ncbi:hypothetical protein GCM10023322_00600 [Rugosimonospora acidiphila]|uniref:Saccharopine dehydrogenase NADP binding domain-containing protein n=1 Tax=Rugosimonospora acidiphila TaxID=556531 RepID=A0ABP9RFW4_9ACTN
MPGRIVLYGATGYTGGLVARSMVASGVRPILAGRDRNRLAALAAQLSLPGDGTALETAVADAEPGPLRDLVGPGDVLVSTAGPFVSVGRAVVRAAADVGAVYLDSTGEPPFIRQVFEEFGPRAEGTGAALLTAFGYDYVPGNLAGALALRAAGPAATAVRVGYFISRNIRGASSAGTRASVVGLLLEPGYALRGGRVVTERTAAHVTSFEVDGDTRQGFSIGSSEHFALPRLRPATSGSGWVAAPGAGLVATPASGRERDGMPEPLTDVGVYLGWFGRATRLVQYGFALAGSVERVPGLRQALNSQVRRLQRGRGEPSTAARIRSDVVAVASDASGGPLATVRLSGADPYSFTGRILAWAACEAATRGVRSAGALGPVEAFGLDLLEGACADAGFRRAPD